MDDSDRKQLTHRVDLEHATRNEVMNALVHLYRGEVGEATAWRSRIDTTSYWAVVLSASALSFVFSEKSGDRHVLIPIITLFCTFLLVMEARRYRFYDIYRSRARTLEINFYRPLLDGSRPANPDWAEVLGQDLGWSHFHIPWWEALGRRLRRNYQFVFFILFGSWLVVLTSYPMVSSSLTDIIARAAIGPFSGGFVFMSMLIFYSSLFALGVYSSWASHKTGNLPAGHPDRMKKIYH